MRNILLIDQDKRSQTEVANNLSWLSYNVELVDCHLTALEVKDFSPFSAILINLDNSNDTLLWRYINHHADCPIIALGASDRDKVFALELGADDFLSIPFNVREFELRLNILNGFKNINLVQNAPVHMDFNDSNNTVYVMNKSIKLTQTEFNLLRFLADNHGAVVTKVDLQRNILHKELGKFDRNVDMHISNIRRKLKNGALSGDLINTVRGQGYYFSLCV